jgi:hypothetical protein
MRMQPVVLSLASLAMIGGLCGSAVAQAATAERCQLLLATFDRYYSKKADGDGSSGSRLDRDVAEAQCLRGNYADGIRQVEGAMRRNQIPIPGG